MCLNSWSREESDDQAALRLIVEEHFERKELLNGDDKIAILNNA